MSIVKKFKGEPTNELKLIKNIFGELSITIKPRHYEEDGLSVVLGKKEIEDLRNYLNKMLEKK